MSALELRDIHVRFGGIHALEGVSMSFDAGRVTGVIGSNGAGKSTLFACAAGALRPTNGDVLGPGGRTIRSAVDAAAQGVGRTFQQLRLSTSLTVYENVAFRAGWRRRTLAEAEELLDAVGFRRQLHEVVGHLSYGDQKKIALARALASSSTALLLDEPASGLAAPEVDDLAQLIRGLAGRGLAVGVIDHNLAFMRTVSDWLGAMSEGALIAEGDPAAVATDPEVIRTYVGDVE